MTRPNILFLMSDEHRFDLSGYAGNGVERTPVLDELAAGGVVFDNAYAPSPICVPGRQCLMAGQLPETCRCFSYGDDLAPGSMTFARRFGQYAYHTTCAGKLHHMGTDQMQGWTTRIAPDATVDPRYVDGIIREELERYTPGPGVGKWSNEREVKEARAADGPYQKRDARVLRATLDYIERFFVDPEYHRPQAHRPLLLKVSLLQPHYPFFTAPELLDYYHDRVPVFVEEPCDHPVLSLSQQDQPVNVTEEEIRVATAAYYGMTETVDTYYGHVLDALRGAGQNLDDWIIIYASDHGDMLGQHGIWEKTRFYEGSVRTPLIIRWPRRFKGGTAVDQNVNLYDLFATLCDLAEIPIPAGLDSRSLVPLMEGVTGNWDNETISHIRRGADHHVMIKRDYLKYQFYDGSGPEVLFDLEQDPGENSNVAGDPAYAGDMTQFRRRLGEYRRGR